MLDVDGVSYEVTVPAGVDAGDSFQVSIAIPDEEGGALKPQPERPVTVQRQSTAALRALQKNQRVYYRASDGVRRPATVLHVSALDTDGGYYTIRIDGSDGERQTERNRLQLMTPHDIVATDSFDSLRATVRDLSALVESAALSAGRADEAGELALINAVRAVLLSASSAEATASEALARLTATQSSSSRRGYLRALSELLPRPGTRRWQDEWLSLVVEHGQMMGSSHDEAYAREKYSIEQFTSGICANDITASVKCGWQHADAQAFHLLRRVKAPLARALRERDGCYSASIYELSSVLARQTHTPAVTHLYWNLRGRFGLTTDDPQWESIEVPDVNGFCGLSTSAMVLAVSASECFSEEGFQQPYDSGATGQKSWEVQDSPVVCFESHEVGEVDDGLRRAAIMHQPKQGAFPPNCLFRFKKKLPSFTAPGSGVIVRQPLIVVTATFHQQPSANEEAGTFRAPKFLGGVRKLLSYEGREAFVNGLDDVILSPLLTMEQECSRPLEFTDWKGRQYVLRDEWAYINGPASKKLDCTPGTRDEKNEGKLPSTFRQEVNDFISERRERGLGLSLPETHARLTLEETLSLRLYSGPAYQLINEFCRNVAKLTGRHRTSLARNPSQTFAATVAALCRAVRKLAAVTKPEEAWQPLYRGVRGELPESFWVPDKLGKVTAVDTAFMSTSRNRGTPVNYMGPRGNVLWHLKSTSAESDDGFHTGASIGLLSQFAAEEEILFPPYTMLTVLGASGGDGDAHGMDGEEGGKQFKEIVVMPSFT